MMRLIMITPAGGIQDKDDMLGHWWKVFRSHKVDKVTVHQLNLVIIIV